MRVGSFPASGRGFADEADHTEFGMSDAHPEPVRMEGPRDSHVDASRITGGLAATAQALASALSIDQLLQVLVDAARDLVDARYAALGVLNPEGTELDDFITSGVTPEQRARIGSLPRGHGILGLLIREAHPLRLADLRAHPDSVGIPPNHPPMSSFLGVPVMSGGRVFGNLYVTEKRHAAEFSEEDLVLLQALASQAAIAVENVNLRRTRDRFFAAASHELGNALAGIRVWARHLMHSPPENREAWLDGTQKILSGAEQTSRLIEDLLSLSRIQEGRLLLNRRTFDLLELLEEIVDDLAPEAYAAGVALRVSAESAASFDLEQDPVRVRQIVVNLVVNAVKFSSAGGTVTVAVEGEEESCIVRVSDAGPGVDVDAVERIFQPYEQVPGVARGRGSGLGLPLSRQLARLMGGEITVDRSVRNGACFVVNLPRRGAVSPMQN
jgi:signal transduction histidine kinase